MEIIQEKLDVTTAGAVDTKRFTMTPSAHVMKMFTSQYSNPVGSMVREYASNMLDAYALMPKDRPFIKPEIHLPNALKPYLEFKDYGVGMSFETVWNVFPSMGDSTKRDNNLEIGGFGLGAKTAFGYASADSWVVESRYNGQKMIFNAYHDKDHWPAFNHVTTVDTDEPNGITIRVPIAPRDFQACANELSKFLEFFPIEVEVKGAPPEWKITKTPALLEGQGWRLKKGGVGSRVVIGPVAYPLPWEMLRWGLEQHELSVFNTTSIDVFVPIGSIEIVPNREAVIFSDRTKEVIKKQIRGALTEARKQVEERIASARNEYEALVALKGVWQSNGLRSLFGTVTWQGKQLTPLAGIKRTWEQLDTALPGAKVTRLYGNIRVATVANYAVSRMEPIVINPLEHHEILIEDVERGAISRIHHYLQNIVYGGVQASKGRWRDVQANVRAYGFVLDENTTKEQVSEFFGGAPVKLVSELPVPERKARAKSTTPRQKVTLVKYNKLKGRYPTWDEQEADSSLPAYFIRMEAGEPQDFGKSFGSLNTAITSATTCGILDESVPIYGIPRTLTKWERTPGWEELGDVIRKKFKGMLKQHKDVFKEFTDWENLELRNRKAAEVLKTLKPDALTKSLPKQVVEELKASEAADKRALGNAINQLSLTLSVNLPENSPEVKKNNRGNRLVSRLVERYPMLRLAKPNPPSYDGVSLVEQTKMLTEYLNS